MERGGGGRKRKIGRRNEVETGVERGEGGGRGGGK